ncbi:Helicase associated domain protein (plasmid) [Streptomyces sp. AM 4-1-1]|uniref:DEAD/DEAH box helicase n=1 Tax=Streptomyces sp. AM 4-1-1 TaxID=3028710 RepID=UPI0023B8B674|nr:DEAD/DEAH box helicase [Streptomyces sp. AM 4-1-1]WEH37848.1 Helicase associated domain protein [Streptomyces sp. AM 4-1-1]
MITSGLWPHQIEAVNDTVSALANAERTTTIMACGTGKSRVGAAVAGHLAEHAGARRVLLVVPFLDLITQMIGEWRHVLGAEVLGRVVAVCSDQNVLRKHEPDLRRNGALITSDPAQLAALTADQSRITVACTYQSLPTLAAAHDEHRLPMWDLIVIDEAHRSVGRASKAWAIIHSNTRIPAFRRLYMTATPKIVASGSNAEDAAISMDDERIFGTVAHRLPFSKAIELGLLADYQVIVPVLTDKDLQSAAQQQNYYQSGRAALSSRMLAIQVAVLRAAHQYGIRRMITFHTRVGDARWVANTLPHAVELLQPHERPVRLLADYVSGTQPLDQRRKTVDRLRSDGDGLVVIANAKIIGEGFDAPGVDAVAFFDPRSSAIDTIQAIGRALRRGRNAGPKTASIIVPVFLSPGEDPESALETSAYAPVWQVIRALSAHDDGLALRLYELQKQSASAPSSQMERVLPDWLRVTGAPVPHGFASAITVQTVRATPLSWKDYYGAAQAYREKHGDLRVHQSWRTPDGINLGIWINGMRQKRKEGKLAPERITALNELDMIWSNSETARQQMLKHLRAFHAQNGHMRVPQSYTTDGEPPYPLGTAVNNLRSKHRLGKVEPEVIAELDALGFSWSPTKDVWEQFLADLKTYASRHSDLLVPHNYMTPGPDARPLGKQVVKYRIRHKKENLSEEKIKILESLGFVWSVAERKWEDNFRLLLKYKKQHGDVNPPASVTIGGWLQEQRRMHQAGKLPEEWLSALLHAGVTMPPAPALKES